MNLKKFFNVDIEISGLTIDSRKVKSGYLFVCVDGINNDGHKYASSAVSNGAICVISNYELEVDVINIVVDDTSAVFSMLANHFYNKPSDDLKVIGITGTDGKTTTTSIIHQMLGDISGYIGTNGIIYKDKNYMLGHTTTPEADDLHSVLSDMKHTGVEYVNLEVTSHATVLKRTADVSFNALGITNITSEHLDMHKTLENYVEAKRSMFDYSADIKVLNADDKYFNIIASSIESYYSYGIYNDADYMAKDICNLVDGLEYTLVYKDEEVRIKLNLIGEFNVYNTLLAIAICHNFGYSLSECSAMLSRVQPIDGRANFIKCGQDFHVVIDFAHTPAGVDSIVSYFKKLFVSSDNKIIAVIGSAGDRDQTKRSEIGKNISVNADFAIYTNEDPRSEDEMQILKDIAKGSVNDNYELIINRKEAIARAFSMAGEGDVVLLLGKGIENSIEYFDGEKPYSEKETATEILLKMQEK